MKGIVRALSLVIILPFVLFPLKCRALTCPGVCTGNFTECKAKGGKIVGYCTTQLACCDLTLKKIGSCGDIKSGLRTGFFQSPEYPEFSSGDLVCKFEFKLSPKIQGLIVEFVDSRMEGNGFVPHSGCESDMIFLQGFPNWRPPPRCGNLTGYGVVIDQSVVHSMKSLIIVGVMSSKKYRWKIKITQVSQVKDHSPKHNEETTSAEQAEVDSFKEKGDISNWAPEYSQTRPVEPISTQRIIGPQDQQWKNSVEISDDVDLEFEEALVVNGKDTLISEVPWQVSLRRLYPLEFLKSRNLTEDINRQDANCTADGAHFCGGSIVSNQFILSAAHCFYPSSKLRGYPVISDVSVVLGDTDLCSDDEVKYGKASKAYEIEKVLFHYGYDEGAIYNDVLIIKLKEKIKFNDYIKPIALSKRNMTYVGKKVKVSGWGLTNLTIPHPRLPHILQSTEELFVQNQSICDDVIQVSYSYPRRIIEGYPKYKGAFYSTLCTSFNKNTSFKLVGQGDSGGPLIQMDKGHPFQVGVVSFGVSILVVKHEHDNKFVDFFQDVSYYRDWIDLAMMA